MKIGIDVRCFAGGKNTGVEEYTKNFLEAIFEQTENSDYTFVLFFNAYKSVDVDFSWLEKWDHVTLKRFSYPNKILNALFWYLGWPKIDKLLGGVDALLLPNPTFYGISRDTPLLITIHDLAHEHYKALFSPKMRIWHWVQNRRMMCARASKIIAVSEATAHDLLQTYMVNPDNVVTIHNGIAKKSDSLGRNNPILLDVKKKFDLSYKFILCFGTIEPRKNLVSAVIAYDALRKADTSITHKLVLAGAKGWQEKKLREIIAQARYSDDIAVIHDLSYAEREALYLLSDILLYPSLFEGFGFPPLEALRAGIPVITSHTSAIPEVVGKNVIMIDPTRPEEIAAALREILAGNNLKNTLSNSTHIEQNLQEFTWGKSARKVLEIFHEIHQKQ